MSRPAHVINRPSQPPQQQPPPQQEMMEIDDHDSMEIEIEDANAPKIAKLAKCPKSLHDLWREYEFGLCGYKAAKDFTSRERGAVKDILQKKQLLESGSRIG